MLSSGSRQESNASWIDKDPNVGAGWRGAEIVRTEAQLTWMLTQDSAVLDFDNQSNGSEQQSKSSKESESD